MRDAKLLIAQIVVSGLLLFVVPWWVSLGVFIVGYIVLGHLTYHSAINTIREVTGLNFFRANKVYKAALSGDWSEIQTEELRFSGLPPASQKGSKARLKRELIAAIA